MKTVLLAATLLAHSWYPPSCCSDRDCFEVPCGEIHSAGDQWEYKSLTIAKEKSQASQDGKCHVCVIPHVSLLCIFFGGVV